MGSYEEERRKVLEEEKRQMPEEQQRRDEYKARPRQTVEEATFAETMIQRQLERERMELTRASTNPVVPSRKRRLWDMPTPSQSDEEGLKPSVVEQTPRAREDWAATPSRWDSTAPLDPLSFFPSNLDHREEALAGRAQRELDSRNRFQSDEEINSLLPSEGYAILEAPANYQASSTRKEEDPEQVQRTGAVALLQPADAELPELRPEDVQYFGKLLDRRSEQQEKAMELSIEEAKERKLMKLLLRIKNGTPPQRRTSLRQLTERAGDFGAAMIFNLLLPLLLIPSQNAQERHLLVKLVDRLLLRFGEAVRPHVQSMLIILEPLLIEEDWVTRMEGRTLLANLAKAAGLPAMLAALRPDIDHADEFVRNTTARTLAVICSSLGLPAMLPFLQAVLGHSRRSWQARHTGLRTIQQTAILLGCAVLPHLPALIQAILPALNSEEEDQPRVRTMAALAVAALAEAAAPHGFEALEPAVAPLWQALKQLRGKSLAATLKAAGQLISLMRPSNEIYLEQLLGPLLREFGSPDEELRRIVLRVVRQCIPAMGVRVLRGELLPELFRHFWTRKVAILQDKWRTARLLLEATASLASKLGSSDLLERLSLLLKDESEALRILAAEAIGSILQPSSLEIAPRLAEQLVDGLLFAFQEQQQSSSEGVMVGLAAVLRVLGPLRLRPFVAPIASMVLWRLSNRSPQIRQQAADLVAHLAPIVLSAPSSSSNAPAHPQLVRDPEAVAVEDTMLKVALVFYENLGEEYPDVLASILAALKAILQAVGASRMRPPIKDLLPRLTPILRNRQERVQQHAIELVGRCAQRAQEAVPAREWMRICFELLDLLKAPRRLVRRAAVNAFGHIARAIGPQDVLLALLNNLRVQERQNRLATTVAIAIVAEACGPFAVLPALLNEYRIPELNVQNGVLKALAFLFEYIAEQGRDYLYATTPLLEDALADRDQVHRQTATAVSRHMALGVLGQGCEDALLHLLNLILPNLFDRSPHLILAVVEALDAMRLALGPAIILQYLLQGLFHPARRVRSIYWKLFNNLYIGASHALPLSYPQIAIVVDHQKNESNIDLRRHVMDIVI